MHSVGELIYWLRNDLIFMRHSLKVMLVIKVFLSSRKLCRTTVCEHCGACRLPRLLRKPSYVAISFLCILLSWSDREFSFLVDRYWTNVRQEKVHCQTYPSFRLRFKQQDSTSAWPSQQVFQARCSCLTKCRPSEVRLLFLYKQYSLNFWLNGDQSLWCHAGPYQFLRPCSHSTPYLSPAVTLVLYFSHALAWCIIASSRPEQAQVSSKTLPQEISLLEGWSAVAEVFANWKTINDLRRCAWQSRSNLFLLSQDFVLTSFRFRAW